MKATLPPAWLKASNTNRGLSLIERAPLPPIHAGGSPRQRLLKLHHFFRWGSCLWLAGTATGFLGGPTIVEVGLTLSGLLAMAVGLRRS